MTGSIVDHPAETPIKSVVDAQRIGYRVFRGLLQDNLPGFQLASYLGVVDVDPIIAPSAHKHDVEDDDMVHAFHHAVKAYEMDEGFIMIIGPSRDASLLEIGYVVSIDAHVIVHAMPARSKFL